MASTITQRELEELLRDGEQDEQGEDFSFTPGSFHPQCGHICTECGLSEEEGCDRDCPIGGETDYIDPEYDLDEWEWMEGNEGWIEFDEAGKPQPDRMNRGA